MTKEVILQQSRHYIPESVILVGLRVFFVAFFIDTLFALIILGITGSFVGASYPTESLLSLWVLHTVKFVLQISLILKIIVEALSSSHFLTEKELVSRHGVINPDEKIYNLEKLQTIEVRQNWLGRLLKYGTLHLVIASSDYYENVYVRGIADPKKYERYLRQSFDLPVHDTLKKQAS